MALSNPRPKRAGIMLAEPFSERRLLNQGRYHTKWSSPYILQPKLNGERCRMLVDKRCCLLLSSTGEIISSVPHINQAGLALPPGEYDGELYVHGWTFSEIHSVVSTTSRVHERAGEMQYHIFDIINEHSQIVRTGRLLDLIIKGTLQPPLYHVEPYICSTLQQIYDYYDAFISAGYEGFIIRNMDAPYVRKRTGAMMKFKPREIDEYPIVKIYEAISEDGHPKGMLGGFTCVDDMDTTFNVGAGKLTHEERISLWQKWQSSPEEFRGKLLRIEYQTLSDKDKVPLFSRAITIL